MPGLMIPQVHRTIAVAADPDWAGTQVAPTDDLIDVEGAKRLGFVVVARDGGGLVVTGNIDLQTVDVSPVLGAADPLVSGSVVENVILGNMYQTDVENLRQVVCRVAATTGVVGATTLTIYWRVLK